jgi:uncharacterized protein YbaR (Trm112 family)
MPKMTSLLCCPHCGAAFQVAPEYFGRVAHCPQCSKPFRIPEEGVPFAVPPPPCVHGPDGRPEIQAMPDTHQWRPGFDPSANHSDDRIVAPQEMERDVSDEEPVDYEIRSNQRRRALLIGFLTGVPFTTWVIIHLAIEFAKKVQEVRP